MRLMAWFVTAGMLVGCAGRSATDGVGSFGQDVAFLKKHVGVNVLSDATGQAKVAVVPAWQGRVMTSTAGGDAGRSFGWMNHSLIASGEVQPHINVFGGEDRFWLGPEGGQFSIFFAPGTEFNLDHWYTPKPLDTERFEVVAASNDSVKFRRQFSLTNYSGTKLDLRVDRTVALVPTATALKDLDAGGAAGVGAVAYESVNSITNTGNKAWDPKTGTVSVWILGMYNASPGTTIVVPVKGGPESKLGKKVNPDYFGPIPPEKLTVKGDTVFFAGDATYRSKIGVGPQRARPVFGSYDPNNNVLTLVQYTLPAGATDYVNSQWKIQDDPFGGDVVNAYSDGPPAPGKPQFGNFYELESSSPAAFLKPGQTLTHTHRTVHLTGDRPVLDKIARGVLGVGLDQIVAALP